MLIWITSTSCHYSSVHWRTSWIITQLEITTCQQIHSLQTYQCSSLQVCRLFPILLPEHHFMTCRSHPKLDENVGDKVIERQWEDLAEMVVYRRRKDPRVINFTFTAPSFLFLHTFFCLYFFPIPLRSLLSSSFLLFSIFLSHPCQPKVSGQKNGSWKHGLRLQMGRNHRSVRDPYLLGQASRRWTVTNVGLQWRW